MKRIKAAVQDGTYPNQVFSGRLNADQNHALADRLEWPTLISIMGCYVAYVAITLYAQHLAPVLVFVVLGCVIAFHSSLQHEVLHGHPFSNQRLNEAIVFPAIGLFIPYGRFRDTHLAHHRDPNLTDPYDDPESNYLDPAVWATFGPLRRMAYRFNNTLAGRMLIGPLIGLVRLYQEDFRHVMGGDRHIAGQYAAHLLSVSMVIAWLHYVCGFSIVIYVGAAYLGMSILKIRTFLEHRAEERLACRSVIIDDRGPLALLFLNNNYHAVHHAHPSVPWYRLASLYRSRRGEFDRKNGGYSYRSYGEVARQYFWRTKDPVPHPLYERPPK